MRRTVFHAHHRQLQEVFNSWLLLREGRGADDQIFLAISCQSCKLNWQLHLRLSYKNNQTLQGEFVGADGGPGTREAISFDPALLIWEDFDWYAAHQCVPVRGAGGAAVYAAADPPRARRALAYKDPHGVYCVIETPAQTITDIMNARFHPQLTEHAVSALLRQDPLHSAGWGLTRGQWACGGSLAALFGAGALIDAGATLNFINLLTLLLFTLLLAFRVLLLRQPEQSPLPRRPVPPHADNPALPVYTILIPMYDEAEMVSGLMAALTRLAYPKDRLDIKLILEEDDTKTLAAVGGNNPGAPFEVIVVPPGLPKTKPKACNYALRFARGDYVVIYDAEDRPEPDQLMAALGAFRLGGTHLVCLQAPLSFYNSNQNWLTRQFTIEYAVWFRIVLPALQRLGLPIPLGGTSNHFVTDFLKKIGGWDPYNVTEDADLGMRIACQGGTCGVIGSTTYEEANSRLGNWIRQRSRWQKGFCQTWAVHMRRPAALFRALGWRGFCGFQLVIGGAIATGLASLASLLLIGAHFMTGGGPGLPEHISVVQWANFCLLAATLAVTGLAAGQALRRTGFCYLRLHILGMPLYWALVCIAAAKGVWQLIFHPYYWEKTRHGLVTDKCPQGARARQPIRLGQPYAISRSSRPQYCDVRSATMRPPMAE